MLESDAERIENNYYGADEWNEEWRSDLDEGSDLDDEWCYKHGCSYPCEQCEIDEYGEE